MSSATFKFVQSSNIGPGAEVCWRLGTSFSRNGRVVLMFDELDHNRLLDDLRITSARAGHVSFELRISAHHLNRLGTVHGGTIASMVDLGGSLAVASRGLFATGVSTDLNVAYLASGGRAGDVLRGEAECDRFGAALAFTRVEFYNNTSGRLAARGSHTKYIAGAQKRLDDNERRVREEQGKEEKEQEEEEEGEGKKKEDGKG